MHKVLLFIIIFFTVVFISVKDWSKSPTSKNEVGNRGSAQSSVSKFQCDRCHELNEDIPTSSSLSCLECHQKIVQDKLPFFIRSQYSESKKRIHHLTTVPSLKNIEDRLTKEWFIDYLQNPKVVRPYLGAMMPRLPMTRNDAEEIANTFYGHGSASDVGKNVGNLEGGSKTYEKFGCATCHEFTNVKKGPTISFIDHYTAIPENVRRAPDLLYTKDRMSRGAVKEWILGNKDFPGRDLMPRFNFEEGELENLVEFIFTAPTINVSEKHLTSLELSPNLSRKIRFYEVNSRIFGKVCRHCHASGSTFGDKGPGNSGGFGFKGKGLSLENYKSVLAGTMSSDNKRSSILSNEENKIPKVVNHLIARHKEIAGYPDSNYLGMPLGLPPIPKEDIELLWGWIEQGAKE